MKKRILTNMLAVLLCTVMLIYGLPITAFAELSDTSVQMVEGDVIADFVPAGIACTSSDPSIAWVDERGSLNAMKIGTAVISDGTTDYSVTVSDYEDGSEVVGNLKILARYNDSMQFYDGHVYLLFTSYQDGVTVSVPDLYAAYEIDDQYYEDISEDISYGSNHTGKDAYAYFRERSDINSVTLDRGEIVTVGMYRGFELSVAQAALGSVQNSSLWNELTDAGKAAIVKVLFDFLDKGKIDSEEALSTFKAVLDQEGLDYNKLLDGVVDGGVCFNRELYNQKLEWDQYENVTYEMDITRDQLDKMMLYLGGNNGNFSILKNSCATVALRAWNAAVGTRNGVNTAFYLTTTGEGIFSIVDAPKTVRDSIVNRLPGYYLNNAAGVAEPNAGYQDETGWVYVSAPEKVAPVTCVYEGAFTIDEESFKIAALINAAKGEQRLTYNKDTQEIGINVKSEIADGWTTISGVDFTVNGTTVSLTEDTIPEDGVQFMLPYDEPADNEYYRLLDQDGEDISGYYSEGYLFIYTDSFPITYRVVSEPYEDDPVGIEVNICGADDTDIMTEVYYKNGDEKVAVEGRAYPDAGTKVYIKTNIPVEDTTHILSEIRLFDENIMNGDHYDSEENAYFVIVPDELAGLSIYYEEAAVSLKGENTVQIKVGDTLDVKDCAALKNTNNDGEYENIVWEAVYDPNDGAVGIEGAILTGKKQGSVIVKACAAENTNVCALVNVEVYDSFDDMCVITTDSNMNTDYQVCYAIDGIDQLFTLPFSGYRISKGAVMTVHPIQEGSKALCSVKFNGKSVKASESVTVTEDTGIKVEFADAKITNLPKSVKLVTKEDTYQLEAQVKYTGLLMQFFPVYDSSITYRSSDPLIAVDENGLISVAGDLPDGGMIAYVTAYAGSSNDKVSDMCKVIVGDYQGDRIVGSLTVSARPIVQAQLISHAMITYTAYEDTDFDVSCYEYYKPNEKFVALMQDYAEHPENYSSDPVLYSDNELGIEDRDSYFDISHAGAFSEPQPVHLAVGNSITISDYGVENSPLYFILKALENSTLSAFSPQAQELVQYINQYMAGEEFDAPDAFDELISTFVQIYGYTNMLGFNPADGVGDGGIMINREAYNQFRRADSQTPNHYYTVDITADELAMLKAHLADPQNNYYSLMAKSCATSSVEIWNTTLADRPELQIKGNFTGLANDPMSIYYEIGLMRYKSGLDGKGGDDYYPRIVVSQPPENPEPEDPTEAEDPNESYKPELRAWYILGDSDGDGELTITDATIIQRVLLHLVSEDGIDIAAADVDGDGVDITDATFIQRKLLHIKTPHPIGERFNRAAGDPVETVDETVIADTSGVKVTVKSLGREYTPYLILTIENSGAKDANISFDPITVNGFQTMADFAVENEYGEDYSMSVTVPTGTTADYKLVFNGSDMEYTHMSEIAQIGFVTRISNPETYQLTASQKATVNTSAYGRFDYSYDESGETVYDNNGIKFVYKGLSVDGMNSPMFYINNQSDKDIFIRVKEFKLNDKDTEGVFGAQVFSGCRAINPIGFFDDVNHGDAVKVIFEICENGEGYGDKPVLYTTDAFSFNV